MAHMEHMEQTQQSQQMTSTVAVLIPRALRSDAACYDYLVPVGMALAVGDIVRVPLRKKEISGVVWSPPLALAQTKTPHHKLKAVLHKHNVPPFSEDMRLFIDWMAAYVMAPKGNVLRQSLRITDALEPTKPRIGWRDAGVRPDKMSPARQKIYAVFAARSDVYTGAELARLAGVSAGVVKGLADAGGLEKVALAGDAPFAHPDIKAQTISFSPEQQAAVDDLRQAVGARAFSTCLLDGVTGSGKTEVYFEAIAAAIEAKTASLVLLPEISLTTQFLARFEKRFGCAPALWHSGLSAGERRRTWRAVAEGRVSVLVGARSALFLPWHNLGVIVVDEEHDGGFKQEEGVIYNARDMAVVRGKLAAATVVLASATPSLETYVNAKEGRYMAVHLPHRHGSAKMPTMALVDMRTDPPPRGRWLAPPLVAGVADALEKGGQGLLYLNRRGYAPLTLCRACGHRYACAACDSWLVEHRFRRALSCHHCGSHRPRPESCDACGESDHLAACGPGVERITEEVAGLFPDKSVAILSSDMNGGATQMADILARITQGEIDIIVGTQIIAKGHHFPKLAFVGVVDADLGLGNGDLRAAERTYQMLSQVAGRAGRESLSGHALLQSYMPEHPVLQALVSGDRDAFLLRETDMRRLAQMPPFGRLAGIIISAGDLSTLHPYLRSLAAHVPQVKEIRVLGPAPAPLARLRGQYRFRFLVKAEKNQPIQSFIEKWLGAVPKPSQVKTAIDIDPYRFM